MTIYSIPGNYYPPQEIIEKVSQVTKIPVEAIKSKSQKREIIIARHIAIHFIISLSRLTETETGKIFSNKDHSTVNWVKKVITDKIQFDKQFRNTYEEIKKELCNQI